MHAFEAADMALSVLEPDSAKKSSFVSASWAFEDMSLQQGSGFVRSWAVFLISLRVPLIPRNNVLLLLPDPDPRRCMIHL
jgi:hypothetical protein